MQHKKTPLLSDYQGKSREEAALEKLDHPFEEAEKVGWMQKLVNRFKSSNEIRTTSYKKNESVNKSTNAMLLLKEEKYSWSKPVPSFNNKLLLNLNVALKTYNKSRSKENLSSIITACDAYIKSIPLERRTRDNTQQSWDELLAEWPEIERVLDLQKNAVSRLFLPEAKTDNEARKIMLRQILGLDEKSKHRGKILDSHFWSEYKFKGKQFILRWIISSNDSSLNLRSYEELRLYNKSLKDRDKSEVRYFDKPKNHQVRIKDGLAYLNGLLLSHRREIIYVMDTNGNIYVNPENESSYDFHHSSFLSGKKILCGGKLLVSDGVIEKISNESGHYKPERIHLVRLLDVLQNKHHLDLSKITVEDYNRQDGELINADKYLKTKGFVLGEEFKRSR